MMEPLIVASHQPDLFPHTGFWYKMANADVLDLAIYDQFQLEGYQRRVKMRGKWATVRLEDKRTYCPITELRVHPMAGHELWNVVKGRYTGSRMWKHRGEMVGEWIAEAFTGSDELWRVNLTLLECVRDCLMIDTPIQPAFGWQETTAGTRVAERVESYREDGRGLVYLSGTGARSYMSAEDDDWVRRGIGVRWSEHDALTGDSILSVLFDHEDPLPIVLREKQAVR